MATIAPKIKHSSDFSLMTIFWETLTNADDGAPVMVPEFADKTIQCLGTPGAGAALSIEGSNGSLSGTAPDIVEVAPSADASYTIMTDVHGNAMTYAAAAMDAATENPKWVRPHVTAGDGSTDWDVCMVVRRPTDKRQ